MRKISIKTSNTQDQNQKSIFQLKYILIFAVLTILGLILLFTSLQLPSNSLWALFLNQLASALIVSGVLSGAFELFLRKDFLNMSQENTAKVLDDSFLNTESILSEIACARKEENLGLTEALSNAREYNYSSLILESKHLTIVLNDGRTWSSNNENLLSKRFQDTDKTTVIILLHPNSPELLALANKTGSTKAAIQAKICETINLLNRIKQDETNLSIRGHHFPNPYSLFLGDEEAVITLYFHAGDNRQFPLFRIQKNKSGSHCLFNDIQKSTDKLKLASVDISQSGQQPYTN